MLCQYYCLMVTDAFLDHDAFRYQDSSDEDYDVIAVAVHGYGYYCYYCYFVELIDVESFSCFSYDDFGTKF